MIWTNQKLKRILIAIAVAGGPILLTWGYFESRRENPGLSAIFFACFACVTLLFCFAMFYLYPIFESYNTGRKRAQDYIPRSHSKQLCLSTFTPSIMSGMAVVIVGFPNVLCVLVGQYPPSILITLELAVPLSITVVLTLIGTVASRSVKRGVRMTSRRMQLCYDCGYDLHGNTNITECPECGVAVPVGMNEKTNTKADPGQGPADHDRA